MGVTFGAIAAALIVAAVVVYVVNGSDEATSPGSSTLSTPAIPNGSAVPTRSSPATAPPVTASTPVSTSAEPTTPEPPRSVGSGVVRATVSDRPFAIRVERGRALVVDSVADGVVVTTRSRRERVTEVLDERFTADRYVARLGTGRSGVVIAADVRVDGDGALRATFRSNDRSVRAISFGFERRRGERFFGFGERATGVDHTGRTIENRVLDGPYAPDQIDIVRQLVPAAGFSERRDATYFPVPWLLSSKGYGVLVDNDETSRFRLATPDSTTTWTVEVDARRLDLQIFPGPRPADVLAAMTARVGRQPAPPAPFVFGPWWQATEDEASELAALQRSGVPMSIAQTYTHYLPCGDERGRRREERARTRRLHSAGLAVTTYINPMVCVGLAGLWKPGVRAGAFTTAADGSPHRYRYSTSTQFDVGQFDFTSRAGRRLFHGVLADTVEDGYDGWMEDFGEYTPADAGAADGTPSATAGCARSSTHTSPPPTSDTSRPVCR